MQLAQSSSLGPARCETALPALGQTGGHGLERAQPFCSQPFARLRLLEEADQKQQHIDHREPRMSALPPRGGGRRRRRHATHEDANACNERSAAAWPENMQLCTPAILYVINMYVFRTIVLAAVVGRPAYQFIDTVYVRD